MSLFSRVFRMRPAPPAPVFLSAIEHCVLSEFLPPVSKISFGVSGAQVVKRLQQCGLLSLGDAPQITQSGRAALENPHD